MNIEKYLILNKYLLSLFGISDFKDLQQKLRDVSVGVDSDGRTHFINVLRSFENLQKDKLSEDTLLIYDTNIQSYVRKINYRREPVSLKYFQYLAVLFTEIVLDNLKNRKLEFLYVLNEFLENYKQKQDIEIIEQFTENDLKKLAFWMATGSGKTLIAHINYYQFFYYNLFSPDNILFITPNEGLSKQHFEELQKSGIPCRLYAGSLNGGLRSDNEVLVIEMTKFVEEKKGRGVRLPVEVFEGRNLVFVDEGHKGKRSEEQKWAKLRNRLAENGFVFEYSATFGQVLNEKDKETLKEYAKSIVFDYSYKYFYLDGYGKDFSVLNVKQIKTSEEEFQQLMFVANLLSFYEQLLVYEENKHLIKEYNIEKPLWIFVGTTVTGKEEESDVIQIVEFINKVIKDKDWVKKLARKILDGKTNLKGEDGRDVFSDKFEHLRTRGMDFDDLFRKIFGGRGSLQIYELKNAEGEFGLKVSENEYFGVINIGNVSDFKKQLEKKGISIGQDAISGSLFDDVKREGSKINLLIGSKKFIEGWDTWRVSSMGLLNVGKGQGPQIIQLFGRGVRLKGKGMSLKRSEENTQVQYLETLNIYGIKADYLSKFLEAIKNEGVEFETIRIPVKPQHSDKWESLYTILKPEDKKFEEEEVLRLGIDNRIYFSVDLLPEVFVYQTPERRGEGIRIRHVDGELNGLRFTREIVDLLNWKRLWQEIYEFKVVRGYWNLVLDIEKLKDVLLSDRYKIITFSELFEIKRREDLKRLEEIALLVIKKYLDLFYRKHARIFEKRNLRYEKLTKTKPFRPLVSSEKGYYTVQINREKEKLIGKIKNLVKNLEEQLVENTKQQLSDEYEILPRIYFDRHLYVPILLHSKDVDRISPPGLVESERQFVLGLRTYLGRSINSLPSEVEIYLLRNYSPSGVGFQLEWSGFYPDFILWKKQGEQQTIAFIDPKGLEHTKELANEKIQFSKEIKEIEKELNNKNLKLESFIISQTPYEQLIKGIKNPPSKEEYIYNHVLFLEDIDWPIKLFTVL